MPTLTVDGTEITVPVHALRRIAAALALAAVLLASPGYAQSNDDDYTPLNSRIKRNKQFPTDLFDRWRDRKTAVERSRSKAMMDVFSKCLYDRSHEGSLDLLKRTDFGFADFSQIGVENDRALRIYGFSDCLSRTAEYNGTGVELRWSPASLRQWLLREAYFARNKSEPTWVHPGNVIGPRSYPLSANQPGVAAVMDVADCVVAADPYTADFFFRTAAGSDDEKQALQTLAPLLGPCLPAGVRMQINPGLLRMWVGEGLWHAVNNSAPAAVAAKGN